MAKKPGLNRVFLLKLPLESLKCNFFGSIFRNFIQDPLKRLQHGKMRWLQDL